MDIVVLVLTAVGVIPVIFLIVNMVKKQHKFDIDYNNVTFAYFSNNPSIMSKKQFCLVIYVLQISNNSDKSYTLKDISLSYCYKEKTHIIESHVVQTGIIQKTGVISVILSDGLNNIILMNWNNIRPKLCEYQTLQPGGVFSGSAVFLFDSKIIDLRYINNLKLIVTNFTGKKSSYPLTIDEQWYDNISRGFSFINKSFSISDNNNITWDKGK